jgi:uncharacterized membrane protein (DUF441 family)
MQNCTLPLHRIVVIVLITIRFLKPVASASIDVDNRLLHRIVVIVLITIRFLKPVASIDVDNRF